VSLVIAKIIGGRVRVESDSQSSSSDVTQQNPLDTVLKAVIVSSTVVVCFAGVIELAHEAIGKVRALLAETPEVAPDTLCSILLAAHLAHVNDIDFILAVSAGTAPCLFKISNGLNTKEEHSAWIGDDAGFAMFQSQYIQNQPHQHDFNAAHRHFTDSFSAVIKSRSIQSVGGFQITVASCIDSGLLKYLSRAGRTTPRQFVPYGGMPVPELYGEMKDGYAYSILTSSEHDTPTVGIHIAQLRFGILHLPTHSMYPIQVRDLAPLDFLEDVLQKFDIRLCGIVVDVENGNVVSYRTDGRKIRQKTTTYAEDLVTGQEYILTNEFVIKKEPLSLLGRMWNLLFKEF